MCLLASLLFSLTVPKVNPMDLDQTVTASVRAMPAPKAVAELARQTGAPLVGMPSLNKDVLVIRVHDVPLHTLMDKIASTLNAGWEEKDGQYRLVRTDALRRQEQAEDFEYQRKSFVKAIETKRKALEALGPFDGKKAGYLVKRLRAFENQVDPESGQGIDWQASQQVTDQSPANRALLRICALLDPGDLAKIPTDRRIVYATQPTKMEVQMPASLHAVLSDFKKEVALIVAESAKLSEGNANWSFGDPSLYGKIQGAPTKVLLSVVKGSLNENLTLQLSIFNEKGRTMGSANANLAPDIESLLGNSAEDAAQQPTKEEPIKYSPDSEELMKALDALRKDPNTSAKIEPVAAGLLQRLLKPEENDPLSYTTTDCLFELARIRNLNLVAAPQDLLGMALTVTPKKQISTLLSLLMRPEWGGKIEDGWFTLAPPLRSITRDFQVDRSSLGAVLRSIDKSGKVSLNDLALFASKNESDQSAWQLIYFLVEIGKSDWRNQGWDWQALRLYGTLTPTQIRLFESKQSLPLGNLSPEQKAIVHQMVFDKPYNNLNLTMNGPDPNAQETFESFYNGIGREPTEAMPNGVPFSGTLTVDFNRDDVAYLCPSEGNPSWMANRAYSPRELANEIYQREHKDIFPWMAQSPQANVKFDRFRMGRRLMVVMRFLFTSNLGMSETLQENAYDADKEYSFSNLPNPFREAYEAAYAQQVNLYKNIRPGQFGGGGGGNQQTIPPAPSQNQFFQSATKMFVSPFSLP